MPSIITKTNTCNLYFQSLNLNPQENIDIQVLAPNPTIKLDEVKLLINNYLAKPYYLPMRYLVIESAHLLTKESAATLLKPLEECPTHTTFLLCTLYPHLLLDTIRSRCTFDLSQSNSISSQKTSPTDLNLPTIATIPDTFTKTTAFEFLTTLHPIIIYHLNLNPELNAKTPLQLLLAAESALTKNANPTIVITDLVLQLNQAFLITHPTPHTS